VLRLEFFLFGRALQGVVLRLEFFLFGRALQRVVFRLEFVLFGRALHHPRYRLVPGASLEAHERVRRRFGCSPRLRFMLNRGFLQAFELGRLVLGHWGLLRGTS
jgi:hypothetical protein